MDRINNTKKRIIKRHKRITSTFLMSIVQRTLKELQLRLGLIRGRSLTYADMADLAETSHRTMSDWMRGATAPSAMTSLLNLLAALPAQDVACVLAHWKAGPAQSPEASPTSDKNRQSNRAPSDSKERHE